MFLNWFSLPISIEQELIDHKAEENGGLSGYIDNIYPCRLFAEKDLETVFFSPVTIIYGSNGSGKSTLLNLIAEKLGMDRIAPFNSGELFDDYVRHCDYSFCDDEEGFPQRLPNGSRIITSDDIFDYMLTIRTNNEIVSDNIEETRGSYGSYKHGRIGDLKGIDDYEEIKKLVLGHKKSVSRREFIRKVAGQETKLNSNGETALMYFEKYLRDDTLYCLDEPENSLAPQYQLKLKDLIEEKAHYCGCQFIIATHSPFILSMSEDFTTIYDLDSTPAARRRWWELENTQTYFRFFDEHRDLFLK